MNGRGSLTVWCQGGTHLVQLLRDAFGQDTVLVRSPHHIQVRRDASLHNIWIDSSHLVKYRLAHHAGRAALAETPTQLLHAIRGYDHATSDLADMRKALELSQLIDAAKAALPLSGLARAVFVDAGINENRAQIGVVEVALRADGTYVRAESRPTAASDSTAAEQAAIEYAVTWAAPDEIIFCDNRSAVQRARQLHGDRIRWLPRGHNKAADKVANLRGKNAKRKRKKRKRRRRSKPPSGSAKG